jgi:ABC-type phosphate/phosphonate transport system substrate-binding protein/rhodanese-related sulfurtransferase
MRTLHIGLLAIAMVAAGVARGAPLKVSVSAEAREDITTVSFMERYSVLARYVGTSAGQEVHTTFARDLTRELVRTRSRGYDVMIGPAHVIGSAIRYGYEPLTRFPGEEHAVFLATAASGVTTVAGAKGKRLALPPADSLATYLARGELNAMGLQAKSHFKEIREYRYHEAALLALELGAADVAVAEQRLAEEWVARHKGRILHVTKGAPTTGVAVLSTLDGRLKDRIRAGFVSPGAQADATAGVGLDVRHMKPIAVQEYEYVSTLGYFTPRVLDGVKIVGADQVLELMRQGVPLYDTRNAEEYRAGHIRGARSLPYGEKSAKEVGFDAGKDRFDLAGVERNAPVIFACNGAECWKSYKSCVAALKAGFKQVHWFRGGYPEWVARSLPTDSAPATVAAKR